MLISILKYLFGHGPAIHRKLAPVIQRAAGEAGKRAGIADVFGPAQPPQGARP
ncbi:MAG: hypothetical protein U0401_12050 [Anaerolineae bacterium]